MNSLNTGAPQEVDWIQAALEDLESEKREWEYHMWENGVPFRIGRSKVFGDVFGNTFPEPAEKHVFHKERELVAMRHKFFELLSFTRKPRVLVLDTELRPTTLERIGEPFDFAPKIAIAKDEDDRLNVGITKVMLYFNGVVLYVREDTPRLSLSQIERIVSERKKDADFDLF